MKHLIIALLLVLTSSAHANQCLSEATNEELLSEISRRMGQGGGGESGVQVTFQCDAGYNLVVSAVNLDTGVSGDFQAYSHQCGTDRDLFSQRLGGSPLRGGKLIAWCDGGYNLVKLNITVSGRLNLISKKYSSQCQQDADAINRKL